MPGRQGAAGHDEGERGPCGLGVGGSPRLHFRRGGGWGSTGDRANRAHVAKGKLAGTVAEPILGKEAKLQALNRSARGLACTPADALAVGTGPTTCRCCWRRARALRCMQHRCRPNARSG